MRSIESIHSLSASAGKDSSTMALPAKKPSVSSGSGVAWLYLFGGQMHSLAKE